jgi:hypothetical protein
LEFFLKIDKQTNHIIGTNPKLSTSAKDMGLLLLLFVAASAATGLSQCFGSQDERVSQEVCDCSYVFLGSLSLFPLLSLAWKLVLVPKLLYTSAVEE